MLDFFVSNALAQAPAAAEPNLFMSLLPLIILFIVFYFLLIRPQNKRMREHRDMIKNLNKGDEVLTQGGTLGRIKEVQENFVILEITDSQNIIVQKVAISSMMPKGTIKSVRGE